MLRQSLESQKHETPSNIQDQEKQRMIVSAGSLLDLSNASTSTPTQATTTFKPAIAADLTTASSLSVSSTPTTKVGSRANSVATIFPPKSSSINEIPNSNSVNQKSKRSPYSDLPPPIYQRSTTPANGQYSTENTPSSEASHLTPLYNNASNVSSETWQDYENGVWKCTQKSMEGVTLTPTTISNLYKEFVYKYHPILPVVDISRGPEKIYQLCPSLFWTIMATAARRYDKDGCLMQKLTPLLKTCLSEITISPVTRFAPGEGNKPFLNVASVYTVQAFIIFTLWPSVTSSLSADSSWNTVGLAMYSAIRVGLHCPWHARDFGRIKADNPIYPKISEQIRTWICCNIVSQTVATVYGFPSFTSFDASVISACQPNSSIEIPETIKQLMHIEHLEEEVAKTLNSNPKDHLGLSDLSERLSLIQILSGKLNELELQLEDQVDDLRKFVLLGARVHLLSYYFLDNGGYSQLQLQKGILQVYNSALALMSHAEQAHKNDRSFFKYLPGIYVQILWQSTTIVCKVHHSPCSKFVDAAAGKTLYLSCVSLISRASIFKHDMMYRASEIMLQLWRLYRSLYKNGGYSIEGSGTLSSSSSNTSLATLSGYNQSNNDTESGNLNNHEQEKQSLSIPAKNNAPLTVVNGYGIRIRSRMSASVFFDALWTMKEICGIRSAAPAILNQRNLEHEEEDELSVGNTAVVNEDILDRGDTLTSLNHNETQHAKNSVTFAPTPPKNVRIVPSKLVKSQNNESNQQRDSLSEQKSSSTTFSQSTESSDIIPSFRTNELDSHSSSQNIKIPLSNRHQHSRHLDMAMNDNTSKFSVPTTVLPSSFEMSPPVTSSTSETHNGKFGLSSSSSRSLGHLIPEIDSFDNSNSHNIPDVRTPQTSNSLLNDQLYSTSIPSSAGSDSRTQINLDSDDFSLSWDAADNIVKHVSLFMSDFGFDENEGYILDPSSMSLNPSNAFMHNVLGNESNDSSGLLSSSNNNSGLNNNNNEQDIRSKNESNQSLDQIF